MKKTKSRGERYNDLYVTRAGAPAGASCSKHANGFSAYYYAPADPKKAQKVTVHLPGNTAYFTLTMAQALSISRVVQDAQAVKRRARGTKLRLATKPT